MGIRKGEEVCDNYGVSFFKHTAEERKVCSINQATSSSYTMLYNRILADQDEVLLQESEVTLGFPISRNYYSF